jgi:4-diphosphocytidyl-2-C-methyl-D-erythritol kinase
MNSIQLKARAKINLGLDVTGCREDGYHEVRMIMQSIRLYDRLRIQKTDRQADIRIQTNLPYLPVNENNLVYKAAKLMYDNFSIQGGVDIELEKFIPVAAGMAGGSSDAAAVMVGMNRLFDLSASRKKLMELGVQIGADVPFCIMRGTVLAEGIGEILTPLADAPKMNVLIAKPPISVSTKLVYEHLRLDETTEHPDIDGIREAIERQDVRGIADRLGNVLENVTIKEYPVIARIKETMRENGAWNALMSGSGPTVFGIFPDTDSAQKCAEVLKNQADARQIYLTSVL